MTRWFARLILYQTVARQRNPPSYFIGEGGFFMSAKLAHGSLTSSTETVNDQPAITIERAAELSGSTPASIKRAKPPTTAEVVANLSTMVDKPKTETQARPLAKLPAAEQPAGAGSC